MRASCLLLSMLLLAACGDDDAGPTDSGRPPADTGSALDGAPSADSGATDLGGHDSGPLDAGPQADAGPSPDTGPSPDDAAPPPPDTGSPADAGSGACREVGLGDFCEGVPCMSGLECMVGRCTPQGRGLCGGFAGAPCDDPAFPVCLYLAGADFGTCVTPDEAACLCERAPEAFGSCM